jgi:hypothetical protein
MMATTSSMHADQAAWRSETLQDARDAGLDVLRCSSVFAVLLIFILQMFAGSIHVQTTAIGFFATA